ncbi:MAG TPA: S16 family serine protease, partial [Tepidisphaeraceae bacterium]|nr:S16 family serine protease [Tepidisphaeraceae bacterium]
MGSILRPATHRLAALLCALLISTPTLADDAARPPVRVQFASGDTAIAPLRMGQKYFINRKYQLGQLPEELDGLVYTHRNGGRPCEVTIDAPAGATVYLLVDSDKGDNADASGVREMNAKLAESGWTRLEDVKGPARSRPAVYKQTFDAEKRITIAGAGFAGVDVAAKSLVLANLSAQDDKAAGAAAVENVPTAGPTTEVANPQATIKAIELYETESGMMLGQTSEAVLTVTRGDAAKMTNVRFATSVGNEMQMARDDALRFIRINYPNWYADTAEITFEDKYVKHDGGSIGAAVGTLLLSVIEGFNIDPAAAITGNISANGKVRAIGGVAAKIRGAVASKCSVVAVPNENFNQLIDAMSYGGPSAISDVQIIGISTLADAVAAMRSDRDEKLAKAIALFGEIQQKLKDEALQSPAKKPAAGYIHSKEAQEKLGQVLALAPEHCSAKLLLMVAQDKQPRTLSPAASQYYTFVAVRGMLPVLIERDFTNDKHQVTPAVVRQGLADLKKVRAIA